MAVPAEPAAVPAFPVALERFVRLFNAAEYWESHEELEGAWRVGRSEFYHGLILYASAFVHVTRGNAHGVWAQLAKAEVLLRPYRPAYLGVDVDLLFAAARAARNALQAGEKPVAPVLVLSAARLRGTEPELLGGAAGQAAG
jgi:predicted metal-dependent hydrolase